MTIGLGLRKLADETWEDCARRYAKKNGLEQEVMSAYHASIASGAKPAEAAWDACCEWDIADLFDSAKGGWIGGGDR